MQQLPIFNFAKDDATPNGRSSPPEPVVPVVGIAQVFIAFSATHFTPYSGFCTKYVISFKLLDVSQRHVNFSSLGVVSRALQLFRAKALRLGRNCLGRRSARRPPHLHSTKVLIITTYSHLTASWDCELNNSIVLFRACIRLITITR